MTHEQLSNSVVDVEYAYENLRRVQLLLDMAIEKAEEEKKHVSHEIRTLLQILQIDTNRELHTLETAVEKLKEHFE